MRTSSLPQEIENLEATLGPSGGRTVAELAQIRRDLAAPAPREPGFRLPDLRLGFACKQRWEDMTGDERVRACNGCDRPVFNLSAMTRDEGERLLATRGLKPCVRFYRRPDGTVMTSDCPSGERREKRRLAVVASSLAAGAALAAPSPARAEHDPPAEAAADEADTTPPVEKEPTIEEPHEFMGEPLDPDDGYEMGVIVAPRAPARPPIEWSVWTRLGVGAQARHPSVLARGLTPPQMESAALWEAAISADVTVGLAKEGNLRFGAFAEARTSSEPVVGGELVVAGLPPHPYSSRIGGSGSVVVRVGGNGALMTAAVGFGYIGSFERTDPWVSWAGHMIGARFVTSMNRSLDDPREWSMTFGLEIEPLGVLQGTHRIITDDD